MTLFLNRLIANDILSVQLGQSKCCYSKCTACVTLTRQYTIVTMGCKCCAVSVDIVLTIEVEVKVVQKCDISLR